MTDRLDSRALARLVTAGDPSAWRELDGRYRSALTQFGERLGMSPADADEVSQEALAAFAEACLKGRFDPGRTSLSSWLYRLVRDRVVERWRRRAVRGPERGESALEELPDDAGLSALWEEQWRKALLEEALDRLRADAGLGARTLAVFTALVLEGRDVASVGNELGLTANAVHQAKFRASQRLRALVSELEDADRVTPESDRTDGGGAPA